MCVYVCVCACASVRACACVHARLSFIDNANLFLREDVYTVYWSICVGAAYACKCKC